MKPQTLLMFIPLVSLTDLILPFPGFNAPSNSFGLGSFQGPEFIDNTKQEGGKVQLAPHMT